VAGSERSCGRAGRVIVLSGGGKANFGGFPLPIRDCDTGSDGNDFPRHVPLEGASRAPDSLLLKNAHSAPGCGTIPSGVPNHRAPAPLP
jgi:hypothetical protein